MKNEVFVKDVDGQWIDVLHPDRLATPGAGATEVAACVKTSEA